VKKKHKQHDEEHIDETWLIPYADLLTLLLALFIVLFASSQIDQKKFDELRKSFSIAFSGGENVFEKSALVPVSELTADRRREIPSSKAEDAETDKNKDEILKETMDLEKLKNQLDQYIQENGLRTELSTKLNNRQLMITISDNALFASGSAAVKPEAQKLAHAISDMLLEHPQYEIIVSGHTDNRPIRTAEFADNWDLGSKRALNFMKILLLNDQISPERFSSVGYGEYRPIATNDTADGRSKNRRVEVSIIRNFAQ
jgi:chemotaxis protein MotB